MQENLFFLHFFREINEMMQNGYKIYVNKLEKFEKVIKLWESVGLP